MKNELSIRSTPALSAIYFALLQCGYDYHRLARTPNHIDIIQTFIAPELHFPFFFNTHQNTCEVYPYWPRAYMLEAASFYLAPSQTGFSDLASLQKHIDSVSSIANIERNQAFWEWLADFPNALHQVLSCPEFHVYLNWEASWLEEQTSIHADALRDVQDIFTACHSLYHPTTVTDISVVVNPIKCVYSSDYHMIGTQFIFCSGSFHKESVVHEFLHHVVHPVIELHRDEILRHPVSYPGIDVSYYLAGQLNAFEEFFVRKLTDRLLTQTPPDNLSVYLSTVLRSLTPSYNG